MRKNWFFGHFSRFHHQFFLIFAQRCILAMLITWPSPIFDKNFFPAENTGNTPGKRYFLNFSSCTLYFFMKHTDAKWQCLKCDRARFLKNIFFRPKMLEICRKKKRFFGIFSRFRHQFSLIFLLKMRFSNAQNMAESNFREKNFSGNMLEIAVSADFLWTFSAYFVVLFRTKTILISLFRSFVRSFVCLFVCSFVHSFVRTLVRTFIIR